MTTTALPTDATQLPAGPDRVDIEALHLSINQTWESGSSQNTHLLENGDIGVILRKGQPKRNQIPCDAERGTIVIALNVDEDHDEVHYSNVAFRGEAGELLSEAITCWSRAAVHFRGCVLVTDRLARMSLTQSGTEPLDAPSLLAGLLCRGSGPSKRTAVGAVLGIRGAGAVVVARRLPPAVARLGPAPA